MTNPINPTDDTARYGAFAVTHPDTQTPYAARVAMLWHDGTLLTLISTLSLHTKSARGKPRLRRLDRRAGRQG